MPDHGERAHNMAILGVGNDGTGFTVAAIGRDVISIADIDAVARLGNRIGRGIFAGHGPGKDNDVVVRIDLQARSTLGQRNGCGSAAENG